ncbi:MAG: GxxExxY protein [Verrucomicrobiota bacterium]|jgi:GxxExxY protein
MADQFRQTFNPELDIAKQLGRKIFGPQLALAQVFALLRGSVRHTVAPHDPPPRPAIARSATAEVSPPGLRSLPDLPVSQAAGVAGQSRPNTGPAFVPSPAFPPFSPCHASPQEFLNRRKQRKQRTEYEKLCYLCFLLFKTPPVLLISRQMNPLFEKASGLTETIIAAAIEVHRDKGPGLNESIYEWCLVKELELRGLQSVSQKSVIIEYKGFTREEPLRFDVLVEGCVLVEAKAVEKVVPIHKAQLLSYMKLLNVPLGLLINFHEMKVTDGVVRLILPGANL